MFEELLRVVQFRSERDAISIKHIFHGVKVLLFTTQTYFKIISFACLATNPVTFLETILRIIIQQIKSAKIIIFLKRWRPIVNGKKNMISRFTCLPHKNWLRFCLCLGFSVFPTKNYRTLPDGFVMPVCPFISMRKVFPWNLAF